MFKVFEENKRSCIKIEKNIYILKSKTNQNFENKFSGEIELMIKDLLNF